MIDIPKEDRDKPFHVIYTNGKFVRGFMNFEVAELFAIMYNRDALDNGLSDRYIAIPKPNTKEEK